MQHFMRQRGVHDEGELQHTPTHVGEIGIAQTDGQGTGDDRESGIGICADLAGIPVQIPADGLQVGIAPRLQLRMEIGSYARLTGKPLGDPVRSGKDGDAIQRMVAFEPRTVALAIAGLADDAPGRNACLASQNRQIQSQPGDANANRIGIPKRVVRQKATLGIKA